MALQRGTQGVIQRVHDDNKQTSSVVTSGVSWQSAVLVPRATGLCLAQLARRELECAPRELDASLAVGAVADHTADLRQSI